MHLVYQDWVHTAIRSLFSSIICLVPSIQSSGFRWSYRERFVGSASKTHGFLGNRMSDRKLLAPEWDLLVEELPGCLPWVGDELDMGHPPKDSAPVLAEIKRAEGREHLISSLKRTTIAWRCTPILLLTLLIFFFNFFCRWKIRKFQEFSFTAKRNWW